MEINRKPTEQSYTESTQPQLTHTHGVSRSEPKWENVDVSKLPAICFASVGDVEDEKTWKYPHHYIENASMPDEHGKWTRGTLMVHTAQMLDSLKKAEKDDDKTAVRHLSDHKKTIDPDGDGHPLKDATGMNAYFSERTVPRYAFSAPAQMELRDNGEGTVSAPVKLIALSGEILDRPEWGPCIQDLSGMTHKGRIAIDWRHNPDELIGYVNQFDISSGQLVLSGALVPQKTHKRTEEIIENAKVGVPFEASIYFPPWKPDDLGIEFVDGGKQTQVNGKTITAPEQGLTVFRKWELRGVAICPHGADGNTAAYLQAQTAQSVAIKMYKQTEGEKEMLKDKAESKDVEAEKKQAAESKCQEEPETKESPKVEIEVEPEGSGPELMKKMAAKFGTAKAAEYYMKGMKYAEALEAFADEARKSMEAAAVAEQSVKQSAPAKPAIKFQQSGDAEGNPHGLTDQELHSIEAYAQEFGLDDKAKERILKNHKRYKTDPSIRRLSNYTPDKEAVAFSQGSTLTKTGTEQ